MRRRWPALLFVSVALVSSCRGGEAPGPVEPSAPECPSSGDRSCKLSSDCGAGAHCSGGHCYPDQAGCPCSGDSADCGKSAHCARGTCYANQAGTPCTHTSQCGPKAHCTVDTCYANASDSPCSEDSDCGQKSACVSGKCN